MCVGTLVHYEQAVRKRVHRPQRPGSRMRRVCGGILSITEEDVTFESWSSTPPLPRA